MLKKGPSIVPPFKNYLAWPPLRYYANHRLCTTSKQQSFYKIPWAGARKLQLPEIIISQLCTRLWWDPGNISPQRACDLQGHDNVVPALVKSVVKWLLLQTEGSKRAGGMQAALAGSRGDDQVSLAERLLGLQPIGILFCRRRTICGFHQHPGLHSSCA